MPVPSPRNSARRGAGCSSSGSQAWRPSARPVALLPSCCRLRAGAGREPAEESRDDGQHGRRLVAQPQGALLRPDDLAAEAREAGGGHHGAREDDAVAPGRHADPWRR
jgi:hypothetical protein